MGRLKKLVASYMGRLKRVVVSECLILGELLNGLLGMWHCTYICLLLVGTVSVDLKVNGDPVFFIF